MQVEVGKGEWLEDRGGEKLKRVCIGVNWVQVGESLRGEIEREGRGLVINAPGLKLAR